MPASVIVVHQKQDARDRLLTTVRAAGYDAAGFDDPMTALDAIEAGTHARLLVTPVSFGPGKLNGVALVRMLHHRRRAVRAIYVDHPEQARHIEGTGDFVPDPADPRTVAAAVARLMTAAG